MNLDSLRFRAELLETIRQFFQIDNVLEVETPILSSYTIPEPFIDSFIVPSSLDCSIEEKNEVIVNDTNPSDVQETISQQSTTKKAPYYLHTSPEFYMKRLLASYQQNIYQICKVFRQEEQGSRHNREFSLLEWYKIDFDEQNLVDDVSALIQFIYQKLKHNRKALVIEKISYAECFYHEFKINPHQATIQELKACAASQGLESLGDSLGQEKDRWLDLLMSCVIDPKLGGSLENPRLTFVYDYPKSQAALAKIGLNENNERVAKRFEVYLGGMELGNGFYELNNSNEQRQRFDEENRYRLSIGKKKIPLDEEFLECLDNLPRCSGVAIGLDRLMMVLLKKKEISDVINFVS